MTKKRGLGRDLESLLGGTTSGAPILTTSIEEKIENNSPKSELRKLPVEYLQRGRFQPRHDIAAEELEELAASIRAQGVLQPIIVRPLGEKSYEIIAGERRWRAAQLAELDEIPALVKDLSDEMAMAIALIENIQREDLNPMEEAYALKRLMEECGLIHEQLAETIGKSRSTITNTLRLLSLNTEVKIFVENGDLDMGHARALLSLEGEKQTEAAKIVVHKGLSVRETEQLVKRYLSGKTHEVKRPIDPDVKNLQDELSEKLGAKVTIQHSPKGKGKLIIQYNNLDEFEGILSHIK